MPLRFENRCPECKHWLVDPEEEPEMIEEEVCSISCPKCNSELVGKAYVVWMFRMSLVLFFGPILIEFSCSLNVTSLCISFQQQLDQIGSVGMILFVISICVQNLKLKNT